MGFFDLFKSDNTVKSISKPDDSITQWANRKPPRKLTINAPESMEQYQNMPYDFTHLPAIYHPYNGVTVYLIGAQNEAIARQDILRVNQILQNERKKNPKLPKFVIKDSNIRFLPVNLEADDFCVFSFTPLTPTGKKSKFPFSLRFRTLSTEDSYRGVAKPKDDIFGELYYTQSGSLGKYEIVCWHKQDMWSFKGAF